MRCMRLGQTNMQRKRRKLNGLTGIFCSFWAFAGIPCASSLPSILRVVCSSCYRAKNQWNFLRSFASSKALLLACFICQRRTSFTSKWSQHNRQNRQSPAQVIGFSLFSFLFSFLSSFLFVDMCCRFLPLLLKCNNATTNSLFCSRFG